MDLISGKIVRKVPLSTIEKLHPELKDDQPIPITFNSEQIINISGFQYDSAVVHLDKPPFENTDDFHIVVNTSELLNSKKIMSGIIDKILLEIDEKGFISLHKDSPQELLAAIPKMEAHELITSENSTLKLTKTGYDVLREGGFEKWLAKSGSTSNESIIRDEARDFGKYNLKLRGTDNPVATFDKINIRLLDFYSDTSKSIFLDEIKNQIIENLQTHRDSTHGGQADPTCAWEKRAEKLLFYVNQHSETLPLIAYQKVEKDLSKRLKVFVSYSRKDISFLDEIKVHFKPFKERIEFWDDSKIEPGQKWKNEIQKALDETKVGILLVSADFLASEFIAENELPPLLNAAEQEGAVILTVILRPCLFEEFNHLNQYQTLNPPSKPIVDMTNVEKEEVYVNLVRQTLKVLKK